MEKTIQDKHGVKELINTTLNEYISVNSEKLTLNITKLDKIKFKHIKKIPEIEFQKLLADVNESVYLLFLYKYCIILINKTENMSTMIETLYRERLELQTATDRRQIILSFDGAKPIKEMEIKTIDDVKILLGSSIIRPENKESYIKLFIHRAIHRNKILNVCYQMNNGRKLIEDINANELQTTMTYNDFKKDINLVTWDNENIESIPREEYTGIKKKIIDFIASKIRVINDDNIISVQDLLTVDLKSPKFKRVEVKKMITDICQSVGADDSVAYNKINFNILKTHSESRAMVEKLLFEINTLRERNLKMTQITYDGKYKSDSSYWDKQMKLYFDYVLSMWDEINKPLIDYDGKKISFFEACVYIVLENNLFYKIHENLYTYKFKYDQSFFFSPQKGDNIPDNISKYENNPQLLKLEALGYKKKSTSQSWWWWEINDMQTHGHGLFDLIDLRASLNKWENILSSDFINVYKYINPVTWTRSANVGGENIVYNESLALGMDIESITQIGTHLLEAISSMINIYNGVRLIYDDFLLSSVDLTNISDPVKKDFVVLFDKIYTSIYQEEKVDSRTDKQTKYVTMFKKVHDFLINNIFEYVIAHERIKSFTIANSTTLIKDVRKMLDAESQKSYVHPINTHIIKNFESAATVSGIKKDNMINKINSKFFDIKNYIQSYFMCYTDQEKNEMEDLVKTKLKQYKTFLWIQRIDTSKQLDTKTEFNKIFIDMQTSYDKYASCKKTLSMAVTPDNIIDYHNGRNIKKAYETYHVNRILLRNLCISPESSPICLIKTNKQFKRNWEKNIVKFNEIIATLAKNISPAVQTPVIIETFKSITIIPTMKIDIEEILKSTTNEKQQNYDEQYKKIVRARKGSCIKIMGIWTIKIIVMDRS